MIILMISQEVLDALIRQYVDRVAEDAIRNAKAYGEIQELERIMNLGCTFRDDRN